MRKRLVYKILFRVVNYVNKRLDKDEDGVIGEESNELIDDINEVLIKEKDKGRNWWYIEVDENGFYVVCEEW